IPREAIWPYVQQWHLDVQREIVKNTVATVSYVGSKGTHLGRQVDLNQLLPVPLSDNPFKPGEVITDNVCKTNTTPSGVAITPGMRAFQNLRVACGDDANFFRSFRGTLISTLSRTRPVPSTMLSRARCATRWAVFTSILPTRILIPLTIPQTGLTVPSSILSILRLLARRPTLISDIS